MADPLVVGVGMHPFGRFPALGLRELAHRAITEACTDAGIRARSVQIAYVGNSLGGLLTGQESVRGQVILRYAGFSGLPIVNVENACASASTALFQAAMAVRSGLFDVALAVGVEKLYVADSARTIAAISTAAEIETYARSGIQFTALYAMKAREYLLRWGAREESLAAVAVKNSRNGALNPHAQFRKALTVEEVMGSRLICDPLRLYMCSSIADGAAAAMVCSARFARSHGLKGVRIRASALSSGAFDLPPDQDAPDSVAAIAREAYEQAGLGPQDVEFAEVHDAAASAEFEHVEGLGLCAPGEGHLLSERGDTALGGRIPVNPSGGLLARGHAIGATGLAQVAELVWQLRGQGGARQIKGRRGAVPKVGLALNTGGRVGDDRAAHAVHILTRS